MGVVSAALLLGGAVAALAGCSGLPEGAEGTPLRATAARPDQVRGDIEVWSWNIAAKSLQKLTPFFQRQYPHVRVNVDMTGANMQARLLLSLASGVGAPDISQLNLYEAPRYIVTGKLADLTPVAAKYRAMFPAPLWNNCTYKGKVYAIPWDMGPCAVYYKRDLFAKYGIDANKIETWDDFIAAGKEILRKSNGRTKMLPLDVGALPMMYELLIQQNEGQMFDAQGRIAINSPQSAQVLEVLKKLLQAGICSDVAMWGQEFMAGFNTDTIASYPEAVWFAGTIKDAVPDYGGKGSTWGVFRLPALEKGGRRVSNLGGSVLVIPAQCRNKEAAWKFLEYALCTKEGQLAQYRAESLFPAFLPALQDPLFDAPDSFFGGQKIGRLFADEAPLLPELNRTPEWTEGLRYLGQALSQWRTSGMDDASFFARLEQRMSRRMNLDIAPTSLSKAGTRTSQSENRRGRLAASLQKAGAT
jgi:lactose/L-arabinose transport system substrate-binding protein